jgi:uncharacterized coiled-coil DUF342 family protein
MSEATETILSAARERIAVLEAEIAEFEAEGRREEIKNLQSVVSTLSKTNKPGRGRPKKDRAEEIKNVLTKVGPLTTEEIAERLGARTEATTKILLSGGFDRNPDNKWMVVS